MTVMAFDEWRTRYDDLSFQEHQAVNAAWARAYPDQKSWNADACRRFLEEREPGSVVELGGWDGALAGLMLAEFPQIETWVNYDITPDVPQVCDDHRYERIVLDDWPWNRSARGDVLVASHVFEHMRLGQIERLVDAWDVDSIYMDVPVGPTAHEWRGYNGSHILEVGSVDLFYALGTFGYMVAHTEPGQIAFLDRSPV